MDVAESVFIDGSYNRTLGAYNRSVGVTVIGEFVEYISPMCL